MQRHSVGPSIDATRRLALKGGASALVLSLFSVPTRAQDAPAGDAAPAAASPDAAQQSAPLTFDALSERMRQRAAEPYAAPENTLPEVVTNLDYDSHRAIRFRPDHALWRAEPVDFHLQAFYPGWVFTDTTSIFIGRDGQYQRKVFESSDFEYRPPLDPTEFRNIDLPGVAGFRIHAPLERPDYFDELVTFLGASYFRALGMGTRYGLSARGLALNTATDTDEEFPRFTAFYIDEPRPGDESIRLMAEMDSPSVAGAYEFIITPGPRTEMVCAARLYFRNEVARLGIAPLTSMYTFGENDHPNHEDFRPEVHDSDGLLIVRANGERLWRPLKNPDNLALSFFSETSPRAFGLLQRDRDFDSYQDIEARYDLRPSLLVEPLGEWGAGVVELVEIPSRSEANDNIVAFWVPEERPTAGTAMEFRYRMLWGLDVEQIQRDARVTATLAGIGGNAADTDTPQTTRRIAINFSGGTVSNLPEGAEVEPLIDVSPAARLVNSSMSRLPDGGWRVSLELERVEDRPVELRVKLSMLQRIVSETWLYQWSSAS